MLSAISGESSRSLKARRHHSLNSDMKPLHTPRGRSEDEMDEGMDIDDSSRLPSHSSSNRFANFFRFNNNANNQAERSPASRERKSEGDIRSMNSESLNESADAEKDKIKEEISKVSIVIDNFTLKYFTLKGRVIKLQCH